VFDAPASRIDPPAVPGNLRVGGHQAATASMVMVWLASQPA
jgi:hypothetical protein